MHVPEKHDPRLGTLAGPSLLYQCLVCGAEVRSMPNHNAACGCGNIRVDPDAGRLSIKDDARLAILRVVDVRDAFTSNVVTLSSPLGPLLLGIVDPLANGASASVSFLLNRSIEDARATLGGHLPDWLVEDIRKNYISIEKVETLWAKHGHRFAVARADDGEMIGTVHIAREHDTILTVNRRILNISTREYPGFKPDGAHHVVNLSVKHEVRRAGVGRAMIDGIIRHFRDVFDGDSLWVRADPPWHPGLVGLGFSHDPSMDTFLPSEVERTAGLPHAAFNQRYACTCVCRSPLKPDFLSRRALAMQTEKLQYVSFLRPLDDTSVPLPHQPRIPSPFEGLSAPDSRYARDWGGTKYAPPRGVVVPDSAEQLADLLRRASEHNVRVAIRGLGRSAAGQTLAENGLVVSTEKLNRIVHIEKDRVVVEGGVTWENLLNVLLPLGLMPPVVTGFVSTTVGGALASGGFSKGSIQHGFLMDHVLGLDVVTGDGRRVACSPKQARWLFESVLGGLGRFGVISSATLAVVPAKRGIWKEEMDTGDDIGELASALGSFADREDAYHATAFEKRAPNGQLRNIAVCARMTEEDGDILLPAYLMPRREVSPRGPSLWAHLFAPRSSAAEILRRVKNRLSPEAGDSLQWMPIRKVAPSRSLVRAVDVPVQDVFFAILITRDVSTRSIQIIEEENRDLLAEAKSLGGRNALGGSLPQNEKEWHAHLGADLEELLQRARMADPQRILW